MAHQSNIVIGGHTVPVWEFDSTAQQIDDAVAVLGGASTPQEALANLGAGVRPNLLDNPGFTINQRGFSQYTGAVQTVDRWMAGNPCTWEKVPGGWKITQGTANGFAICQKKEKIAAGTYTISIIVSEVTGTWGLLIQNQQQGNLMITEPGVYSATVTVAESDASPYLFILYSTQVGDTITLPSDDGEVAKVEEGGTQTLAYQKSDGTWAMLPQNLDYGQELAKCQAYLIVVNNKHYVNGAMYGTREGIFELSVPQMRTTPAIVSKSIERILDSKGTSIWTENISTVEVLSSDSAGVVLKVTTTVDAAIGPATLINFKAKLTADL